MSLFRKKTGDSDSDHAARIIKLYIAQAADQGATKIVLGQPCEGQRRLRSLKLDSASGPPLSDEEDRVRFVGQNEPQSAEEQRARAEKWRKDIAEGRMLPVWFKMGETYEERCGLPAFLIFEIMSLMKCWDGGRIPWEGEQPDWKKVADLTSPVTTEKLVSILLLNLPSQLPNKPGLSNFFLRLLDGRIIEASFGFEPSFCLSISLRDTGRKL